MSSRAIRKLQKLREQEQQRESDLQEESSEDEAPRPAKPKFNAFDLLNAENEDEEEDEEDIEEEPRAPTPEPEPTPIKPKKSNKKKKKKAAKTSDPATTPPSKSNEADLDEIDRALKELSTSRHSSVGTGISTRHTLEVSFPKTTSELLGIEPKFLNATNEMRRLFGNVVLENFDQPADNGTGRRRDRNRQMVDLAQALTGRYSPASRGQSLAGVTLRRNVLMQGKDEWPRAPSGGLGMETVEKLPSGETLYRLVHNTAYQDVQRQFDLCVESMDPQRLIGHLQYNPYHISTLLQVSEIAKHQGDHAVSADLMERALFNIGRSVHSSFANRLKEGEARLDFIHAENRELWLVGWRYITNLAMKGTWRTAYEWAKLLLSLDSSDPYCMRLLIDHLALRGREYAQFVQLCTQTRFSCDWANLPNIQCSLVIAYLRLNKPQECRRQLQLAMSHYPWMFSRLAQELDVQHVPKQIWGKMPPTGAHELLTELYIARAKDLWNTPEAISLIVEVADSISGEEPNDPPKITLDIARHVVLSDIAKVTTHLPNHFVAGRLSSSDPLPPYESEAYRQQSEPAPIYAAPTGGGENWLQDLLGQINHDARPPNVPSDDEEPVSYEDESEDTEHFDIPHSRPPLRDPAALEGWLTREGLQTLRIFLSQYGVDRGNWSEVVVDYAPLTNYLEAMAAISETTRQRLLDDTIKNSLGDFAVSMLEDELAIMRGE
ncbi:Nulp1-pending protein [Penicillium digitatum]|uniref:Nulp1-pending protein n=3 Tax=Penicillium digitatum TaxID=36651 RepID=K9G9I4_PEND2|nr:Nulp1-pending protein [Penicillium digitatum Pd1]EKV08390.1 Nulp1-pending protein [Penicillium digitatum Pd1]EKV09876.1 Nulp1-pending protein [Penicillium digitatum PHI26]QQK41676.1 Nulp1-pending protein [Penicillium digitatum]